MPERANRLGKASVFICLVLLIIAVCVSALADTGTVKVKALNIRKTASTSADVIAVAPKNAELTLVSKTGTWYKVKYDGKTGYASAEYIKVKASTTKMTETKISDLGNPPSPTKKGDTGKDVLKLQKALTILKYYSGALDSDYGDATVTAVKKYQKAKKLTQDGVAGEDTINSIFGVDTGTKMTETKISDLGDPPQPTKKGDSGKHVLKLQKALTILKYYSGALDGDYGEATETAVTKYQKKKGLTQDGVAGRGTIKSIFGKYPEGTNGEITAAQAKKIAALGAVPQASKLGDKNSYVTKLQKALKIAGYFSGTATGYYGEITKTAVKEFQSAFKISADGVAGNTTLKALFGSEPEVLDAITTAKTIKALGEAPLSSKSGDSGEKVKKLQQALKIKGYYSGTVDGKYGDATVNAVKKFQKKKGFTQNGVAGRAVIKALFGSNNSKETYTTESLDWFNGGANVIPRGAVFEIKDCLTGKTFTVRRWAGANHIDAEPYTKSDTATMKSIYGGSWSWARRAILVKYNGHVYAASMNGMPHGTTTINNDFDGHFCIHFTGSKTHESKKVDAQHQACVKKALKYTW